MPSRSRHKFWRLCRIWFRHFRLLSWLTVLAALCAVVYLTQIGLPRFAKGPLLAQLRQRGLVLEFTRLRLSGSAGFVADDVRLGPVEVATSLRLTARRADLNLNWRALLRGRLQVEALGVRNGRFEWPFPEDGQSPRSLAMDNIQAWLRLCPDDEWVLDDFSADYAGARLFLSGTITNASALREWTFLRQPGIAPTEEMKRAAQGTARRRLRLTAEAIGRMSFATPPELRMILTGDARDPQTFALRLNGSAPDAKTPWGNAAGLRVNARLIAATATAPSRAELTLEAAAADTRWGQAAGVGLKLKLDPVAEQPNLVNGDLVLLATCLRTAWVSLTNADFSAQWVHTLTNPIPLSGSGGLCADTVITKWAGSKAVRVTAAFSAATNPPTADADWAWWTNVLPYQLTFGLQANKVQSRGLEADKLDCAGGWAAPALTVSNLNVVSTSGVLEASGKLDVPSRKADVAFSSGLAVAAFSPLFSEGTRRRLDEVTWSAPPKMRGAATLILPAWINRHPDWRGEILPTLQLAGHCSATNLVFHGVSVGSLRSSVACTNRLWQLPDLEIALSEGRLRSALQLDLLTQTYYSSLHSTLDPRAFRPWLSANAQRGLDFFTFAKPPVVQAEVWGDFHDATQFGACAQVAWTNFSFRDTPVSAFTSGVAYSNRLLTALEPRVWRSDRHLRASNVAVDLAAQRVHFSNVFSTDDPLVVTRAIGPKTARAIEPYVFAAPPTVRLNGTVPMRGSAGADLRVEVAGGPFTWWKFRSPHIVGSVHWLEDLVTLTNVTMAFCGGEAQGWGVFDAKPSNGTECRFTVTATNADFHALMGDLTTPTNRLEGTFSATLNVTHGNTADWRSWNGYGDAQLHDGWIWSIPVFGVLSAPLDNILPGLGNSRVTSGSGQFVMTNGVVFSEDLEWRAPAMRLQYVGTTDLQGQVHATVQTELLRDTWLVGRIVSLALWPISKVLEFKVTGTLDKPKAEPLYIPKLLTSPLRSLQTLHDLFPDGRSATNAPPAWSPP